MYNVVIYFWHSYRQTHRQTDIHALVKIIPHSYRQTHKQTDTQ